MSRLRLEPELLARLKRSSKKSGRSLSDELSHRLRQSFKRYDIDEISDLLVKATVANFFNAPRHD
jgi:hypothetical protein